MNHDYLTIVSIVGHNNGSSFIPALTKSLTELPGSPGLLISISKPKNLPTNINWMHTLPLSYRQYSLFVMFSLQNFIKTEYCLIVQDDSWVLNGRNWSKDFLNYDYIGAPNQAAFIGDQFIQGYQWVNENQSNLRIIQNGGFSLRSKKLLKAPSTYGAMYYFSEEPVFQLEDVQLTGIFKNDLENLGIKFAPVEIAKNFSIEYLGPKFHDDVQLEKLVGIHGQSRKLIDIDTIQCLLTKKELVNFFREIEVLNFLSETLNYKIIYPVEG